MIKSKHQYNLHSINSRFVNATLQSGGGMFEMTQGTTQQQQQVDDHAQYAYCCDVQCLLLYNQIN